MDPAPLNGRGGAAPAGGAAPPRMASRPRRVLPAAAVVLSHFETPGQKALFAFCLAASVGMVALAVGSVGRQVGRPSPGFLIWENLVVPAVGGRDWPGAQAGVPLRALLIEADGQPVAGAAALRQRLATVPDGTPLRYAFIHDGRRVEAVVPTTRLDWRLMLPVVAPYLLIGVAFFATGLVVFYFRPDLPASHAGLALGMTLGGTLVLALDTLTSFWLQRVYFLVESMVPSALLHFALCFPEPKQIVRRHPSLVWLAYLPGLALGAAQNAFLAGAPLRHLEANDWVYVGIALAGIASIASLLHAYRTSASPLARQRAKVVAGGVALAALVPSLVLLAVIGAGMDLPINFIAPFFLLYPLSIVYAVARHDLFEVDRYLRLGVVYGAMTVLVVATYAGLTLAFERWSGAERRLPDGAVPIFLIALLLLFEPARARIQRLVDRLFFREGYSYRATVEATSRALAALLDTDRIAAVVLETLTEVMAIEWGALTVLDDGGGEPRHYARPSGAAPMLPPALLADAVSSRRIRTAYADRRRGAAGDPVLAHGAALLVPAWFEQRPLALLALGGRKSGAAYSGDDVDLIQTLANQAALALHNARATEDLRRTQEALVRHERLAAVGELSAAVAHGIRNPLAGIRAAAQVAREDPDEAETVRESLDDIIHEADRLEHRVRSLLDFARPFEPTLERGQINPLVTDVVDSLRRRLPPAVAVRCSLADGLPAVAFDPVQMTEVLEALAVNAVEAMHAAGALTIATRPAADGAGGVELMVSDTGPGLDAAQQRRVFDLFYTTKPTGTGLGLATVKRLVDRHGGRVRIDSAPGAGAAFVVTLPAA